MLNTITTPTIGDHGNDYWQSYFSNTLSRQANRLIELVNENKKTPNALQRHFDSILTVFRQGSTHPDPATRLSLVKLVHDLHPLPVWWGKWNIWLEILEQATLIAQEFGTSSDVIWLKLTQAEMLYETGHAEDALVYAKKAHALAILQHDNENTFRAELVIFEAKKFMGEVGNLGDALHALETSLAEKKNLLPYEKAQKLKIKFLLQKIEVVRRQKEMKEALQIAAQVQEIAEKVFDANDFFMTKIFAIRSSTYWANQEYELAITATLHNIGLYKHWGNQNRQLEARGRLGLYYWSSEQHAKAEKMLQTSIQMAEKLKHIASLAADTGNLSLVYLSRGKLEGALALTQQHYRLSQSTNNLAEIKRARGNMGSIQTHLGDFQNALDNLREDHEHAQKGALRQPNVRLYAKIAWALDGLGRYDEAMEHAEKSLFLAQKIDEPLVKLMALRSISEVTKDMNDKLRYAEEARQLAVKHSRRLNEAATLLTLAGCRQDDNLRAEATRILQEIGAENWLNAPPVFETPRIVLLL